MIRECAEWSLTGGSKQWKILNCQAQKVVAVAYRWSFTSGSNCKAFTGKIFDFLDWRSLKGGGRLPEVVVAHGGSTVLKL